jgi:hypothetical protein
VIGVVGVRGSVVATFTEEGPIGLAFARLEPHGPPHIAALPPDGCGPLANEDARRGLAVGMRL